MGSSPENFKNARREKQFPQSEETMDESLEKACDAWRTHPKLQDGPENNYIKIHYQACLSNRLKYIVLF